MQALTIATPPPPLDEVCMSQGGLVDRETAAGECVVLWTDLAATLEPVAALQAACTVCAWEHGVA